MLFRKTILLFLSFAAALIHTQAQQGKTINPAAPEMDSVPSIYIMDINPRTFRRNDTVWKYSGICKTLKVQQYKIKDADLVNTPSLLKPAITVHGNIQYDFLYRSYADTPFYQKDFKQHTIQSSIRVTVKDKYSFRFNLLIRKSNSPYFKNFLDGGLQFDKDAFITGLKQNTINRIRAEQLQKPDLQLTEEAIALQQKRLEQVKGLLNKPDLAQMIIEEREKLYYQKLATSSPEIKKAPKIDSVSGSLENYIADKKKVIDSLEKKISGFTAKADSIRNSAYQEMASINQQITKARNLKQLQKINTDNGVSGDKITKGDKIISGIRSIGIGKSVLNYSELTASNISLTGINMEYNPGIYAAFAAGKIDYGFRDFFGTNKQSPAQNLLIGRLGIGDKDRMAFIVSVFTGRKYTYGSVVNDTVNSYLNVTGYSAEAIIKKNENSWLSVEAAKSTRPITGRPGDTKEFNNLFKLSDKSNQAISIKGNTLIPETQTRLSGFFRKTGQNFQSFSLFSYNTDQTAWLLRADQPFLMNRISLTTMLRRNDFTNPFAEKTFKTTTVFSSAQLNIRFPKWPSISAGYFPGSQLYVINAQRLRENVYYIINGSLLHSYSLFGTKMISSIVYNRYSNKGTDSGFINYSGTNLILSHSLLYRRLQLQGNYIYTSQEQLKFFTLEANGDYSPVPFFRVGAGGKYNRTQSGKVYWGGRAQVFLEIKKMGGLQLQYEKSFLPTIYQTLFPVELGRVSWFKYF